MTKFELWLKSFEGSETECCPYLLEGEGCHALYMTKDSYMTHGQKYYKSPVYHVWWGDKWIAIMNYREAYQLYENMRKDGGGDKSDGTE